MRVCIYCTVNNKGETDLINQSVCYIYSTWHQWTDDDDDEMVASFAALENNVWYGHGGGRQTGGSAARQGLENVVRRCLYAKIYRFTGCTVENRRCGAVRVNNT